MKPILAFLFFWITLTAFSQENSCNCLENLEITIEKTEVNYAGYPAKVTDASKPTYQLLKDQLQNKARTEFDPKKCFYLLKEYVDFFRDKHFILSYYEEQDYDSTVVEFTPERFEIKSNSALEGFWVSPDGLSKIAIIQGNEGNFQGIKIESSDPFPVGFVYFTLTPDGEKYLLKSYDSFMTTTLPAKQIGNLLRLGNQALWGKVYPQEMNLAEKSELATWLENNNGLTFRKLAPDVSYLKIPTFKNNDSAIQQLVALHDSTIRATEYLVVDLTGNLGGNTGWVFFLPYLMTQPVVQHPSFLRVTPENVQLKLQDLEPFVTNPIPEDYQKYFPEEVLSQYRKAYQELPITQEEFYPVPGVTFPLDSVMKYPRKVALVVDDFSGSSAEYFFQLAKQSQKTTSYGMRTFGMMDYEGMSNPTPLPYEAYYLTIPIAKSSWTDREPIDETGFTPDVLIDLPQGEWMEFILKDLRRR
ncbi:S41 family peptidase [Algoriphagus litoralis]|uniref:S41 family peptidase n=1 Tax=Algoriphagus litoralis TaxID=2202829 RepID=UPI000DB9DD0A|nr:S41 family peptidase [Algoriphagus litoralis]